MNPELRPTATDHPDKERLEQLLADRATEGLDAGDWEELAGLLDAHPDADPESWELAAAWTDVLLAEAHAAPPEPIPDHLRRGIVAQGRLAVRGRRVRSVPPTRGDHGPAVSVAIGSAATGSAATGSAATVGGSLRSGAGRAPSPPPRLGWLGTAAGIAAGFALALLVEPMLSDRPIDPDRAYDALQAEAPDALELTFEFPQEDGARPLRGTVIWSDERQEGYLRFEGLPPNDPTEEQYQLWIVDPDVDPKHPVDGGVFDIADAGRRTIPIDAKLTVDHPKAFVVTREHAGGTVVSGQKDVRAVAKVSD